MGKIRIMLLAGGWSRERDVSLKSGITVYNALDKTKYEITMFDPGKGLKVLVEAKDKIDLVFNLLHGKSGEDGSIQGFLNIFGLKFIGSDVLSSAMAFNKRVTKDIYKSVGLTVCKDISLKYDENFSINEIKENLGHVLMVKPVSEGSSFGISICHTDEELKKGIEKAFQYDKEVIIEEYIEGREVSCCVLGNMDLNVLPLVEVVPGDQYGFFDYNAKYIKGAIREICPAPLSPHITDKAGFCAKQAHNALRCRVWSRTDMIIKEEEIYMLETNTIPGMTENSLFPLAARKAGISLKELLDRLILYSLE